MSSHHRDCVQAGGFIAERNHAPWRWNDDIIGCGCHAVGESHVPNVIVIEPDSPFAGQQMEWRDLEIADAGYRPYIRGPGLGVERRAFRTVREAVANGRDVYAACAGAREGLGGGGESCAR